MSSRADEIYMQLSSIALEALERAQAQLDLTAERLSGAGQVPPDGAPVDTVDLSREVVALLSARTEFATHARVLETANEIDRQVVDLLG